MQDKESNEIPLIKAIRYTNCSLDEFRRFIPSTEYINLQDIDGHTALHFAAKKHLPLEHIRELNERGADLSISDNEGNNMLHYVASIIILKGSKHVLHSFQRNFRVKRTKTMKLQKTGIKPMKILFIFNFR